MFRMSRRRLLLAVIIPLLACFALAAWYQARFEQQQARNAILKQAIAEMDREIGPVVRGPLVREIVTYLAILEHLGSATGYGPVQILADLSEATGEVIQLDSISLQGKRLELRGVGYEFAQIEAFAARVGAVDNLVQQELLTSPSVGKPPLRSFRLILKRQDVVGGGR